MVLAHLSGPNKVFVHGLALYELPKAVLTAERVKNLTSSDLIDEVVDGSWHVDESLGLREDRFAQSQDLAVREFFGVRFNLGELLTGFVGEMSLVELEESHHFAQVEVAIQMVVKSPSEVVDRVAGSVRTISGTVVDKISNSVNVVSLQGLLIELLQVSGINGGE